jgi:hypothetical protein
VRALLWPQFTLSTWALAVTVMADNSGEGLVWPLFTWSVLAQSATELAVTTDKGEGLASVRSLGVCSTSHCDGGHDR